MLLGARQHKTAVGSRVVTGIRTTDASSVDVGSWVMQTGAQIAAAAADAGRYLVLAAFFTGVGSLFVAGMAVGANAVRTSDGGVRPKYLCVDCRHRLYQHRWDLAARHECDCTVPGCSCTYFTPVENELSVV